MKNFLSDNFLLETETAQNLYHNHAAKMPIYDYHCHLPVKQIADDHNFENITQAWLYGDHYKWRAMRTNGVDEKYITGDATDKEKFVKWAETVPYCMRNPLYHWTHLELKNPFGIDGVLLNEDTAEKIYKETSEKLASEEFSVRNILRKMNVKLVCTTEDPLDSLEHHKKIRDDGFEVKVHTAWRADRAMAVEDVKSLNEWIDRLSGLVDEDISNFDDYLQAISQRHEFFHSNGCRLSDHGLKAPFAEDYTKKEIDNIFARIRSGKSIDYKNQLKFKSAMLYEFGIMDYEKGWVQQFHIGALRNNNTRMFEKLGADTGFDSIGDFEIAEPLAKLLDWFASKDKLAKTILYNLNPRDNELMATMIGNFQDGSCPGKMQFGSGWWFLDQKQGMEEQMNALSNLGLLSRFVGMLTDSRSFLSFGRHEYFRRVLCNLIGNDIEHGLLPGDMDFIGRMVEDICYYNACSYFPMEIE
jgi:glucuronate isomerase